MSVSEESPYEDLQLVESVEFFTLFFTGSLRHHTGTVFREVLMTALVDMYAVHLVPLLWSLDWTPPLQEREQGDQAVAAVSWLGPTNTAEDTSNCNMGRLE